jgi:hypothetical protein
MYTVANRLYGKQINGKRHLFFSAANAVFIKPFVATFSLMPLKMHFTLSFYRTSDIPRHSGKHSYGKVLAYILIFVWFMVRLSRI